MRTHILKIKERFFNDTINGNKKSESRVNDRDFEVGDRIILVEISKSDGLETGRFLVREITHILTGVGFGVVNGFIVMSLCNGVMYE